MKKETAEKLSSFRRQQEEADRALLNQANDAEGGTAVGKANDIAAGDSQLATYAWKKRKRVEKEVLRGVKLRKGSSSSGEVGHAKAKPEEAMEVRARSETAAGEKSGSYPKPIDDQAKKMLLPQKDKATQPGLGLAAYSSDEED